MWHYIRYISKRNDHTIVSGDWFAKRLQKFRIKDPIAIPFGIDKSLFSAERKSKDVQKNLLNLCNREADASLLLIASRFHPEKRLRTLFEAVNEVNKSHPVGLDVFGEEILSNRDRKYASDSNHIYLAGLTKNRGELAIAYASGDLKIHGSASETFGLGVAEALCSGLPVVALSVGGAADLVVGKFGVLYKPGKVKECALAIKEALQKNNRDSTMYQSPLPINSVEDHFDKLFELYEEKLWVKENIKPLYSIVEQNGPLKLVPSL